MEKYNSLIIGAGVMGAGKKNKGPSSQLSYAEVLSKNPHFRLVGFMDKDIDIAKKAARLWGGNAYSNLNKAANKVMPDVVVIATPDRNHEFQLNQLINIPIKLICCEKPVVINYGQGLKLNRIYKKKGIPVIVNYSRRFVPEFKALKSAINKNKFGSFIGGTGYYCRGLFRNGSHLINLLQFLFNEISVSSTFDNMVDGYKGDPSVGAILKIKNNSFVIQPITSPNYSVFELILFFEFTKIVIKDLGREIVIDGQEKISIKTQADKSMEFLIDLIFDVLDHNRPLESSFQDALNTINVCHQIRHLV